MLDGILYNICYIGLTCGGLKIKAPSQDGRASLYLIFHSIICSCFWYHWNPLCSSILQANISSKRYIVPSFVAPCNKLEFSYGIVSCVREYLFVPMLNELPKRLCTMEMGRYRGPPEVPRFTGLWFEMKFL